MRAIDADALLQRWNNLLPRMARDKDGAVPIDFCLAIHEVSATPTLTLDDLRPKGRWIMRGGKRYCSHCGERACVTRDKEDFWYTTGTKFCSECGADTRGDGEE